MTFGAIAGWVGGLLVVSGLVYWRYVSLQPGVPESGPELERVRDLAAFRTFNRVDDGWVAVLDAQWPGLNDTGAVTALCTKLTDRLAPMDGQTIEVLRPDGEPLRNCQARQ